MARTAITDLRRLAPRGRIAIKLTVAATDILCTIFPYLSVVDFLSFTSACVGQRRLLLDNLLNTFLLLFEGLGTKVACLITNDSLKFSFVGVLVQIAESCPLASSQSRGSQNAALGTIATLYRALLRPEPNYVLSAIHGES